MAYPGSGAWWLADKQDGPECGFEAIENVIQHYWPVGNIVSETVLKKFASRHGYLLPDGRLDHKGYQTLLSYFQIGSRWSAFDHRTLIAALNEDRIAVAILDAYHIDRPNFPTVGSGHAILISKYVMDSAGFVVRYTGFDSNYEGQMRWWNVHAVEQAAGYYAPTSLLITDYPVHASYRKRPYAL